MNNFSPIFGDDGFRSEFGVGLMSKYNLIKFSDAFSEYIKCKKLTKQAVLIARDTRSSGKVIETILSKHLIKNGIKTIIIGILPTPGLSKVLEMGKFAAGIMITASHNPAKDNGIKLFSGNGHKLKKDEEIIIENTMRQNNNIKNSKNIEKIHYLKNAVMIYVKNIPNINVIHKINKKILVDCAHGAMASVAKKLFQNKSHIKLINISPTGHNINRGCGALEIKSLEKLVKKGGFDYGVAFDGDGDRAVFVSRKYGAIEPEKVFYLMSVALSKDPKKDTVVCSEITNQGVVKELEKKFKKVYLTPVGDRNVTEKIQKTSSLGGMEPSGHFNFLKTSKSMDGMISFLNFCYMLNYKNFYLEKKLTEIFMYKRILYYLDNNEINDDKKIIKEINSIKTNRNERIIARISIWDPLIKIYYDYMQTNNFPFLEKKIRQIISKSDR